MKALLALVALVQVALGLLLWLAPGFFHTEVGPYGPRNDHYMGDLATWYLALGALLLVSIRQASWRLPVLLFAFVQNTLHAFNHLLDVDEAIPAWLGPVNLASLVLVSVLLAWMANAAREPGG